MRENSTDITLLLDRSGSMESKKTDVIGGVNAFFKTQAEVPGECLCTLVQFDGTDPQEVLYSAKPVKEVPPLTEKTFLPRGNTPLRDALGLAIVRTGERLAAISEAQRPSKVIFVLITDGYENASREYNQKRIQEMKKLQEEAYGWDFVFLGADIDAIGQAGDLNIGAANTISTVGPRGMSAGLRETAKNVASYRVGGQRSSLAYSEKQRDEAKTGATTK